MKWEKIDNDWALPVKSWCADCEEGAVKQAANLARHPALYHHVALMPDAHQGYGMPIGGVVAADAAVIPAAVGVDIGCGMLATKLKEQRVKLPKFDSVSQAEIPAGMNIRETAHSLADEISVEELVCYKKPNCKVSEEVFRRSLGTLGGGNHFIELQKTTLLRDPGSAAEGGRHESKVWLMIHSGSRNLGKRIEEHYHRIASRLCTRFRVPLADPDLAFLPIEEKDGHDYFTDMLFALRYAKENRRRMMEAMKETLLEFVPEANFPRTIDIHHNYAACEEHFGKKVFVHRKGATSAKLDEIGVIPGSMGTASYIVRGLGNHDSFMSCSHGAGRRMSRVAASTTLTVEECDKAMDGIVCERWHRYRGFGKAKGRLDLSEAPQAYKDIEDVIASERDLVEPLVRLVPLASLKG